MRIDDDIGKVALPVPVMIYILFNTDFHNSKQQTTKIL